MTAINAERKNTVVSEGVHAFKIMKSEEKTGKESGEPYWNFQCSCTDKGPDEGLTAWLMISLSPQARFKVDQFLDAINAPESGNIDHPQCVGKTFKAEILWDSYQGNIKAAFGVLIPWGKEYTPKASSGQSSQTKPKNGFEPTVVKSDTATETTLPATPGAIKPPF
jgi:hypothetical protein